jgi:4-amino-4-deoxy-L-arabinose transferase-like glycosyltransferase
MQHVFTASTWKCTDSEFRMSRAAWPLVVTVLLIGAVWLYHLQFIAQGGLVYGDEFHTLDRSTGFRRHGDWWTVYGVNWVTFKKPPLQYWMTAGLLEAGFDPIVALRLPSMLFSLGALVATAALAAIVLPARPWVIPAAVLLYAGSTGFWVLATSAMLDTGAAFFSTLALLLTLVALRRPLWWYAVSLAIGLGAMQKAPVGLVLVALYLCILALTRFSHGIGFRELWSNRHFRIALLIAIVAAAAWPLFQILIHGDHVLETYRREMLDRFNPFGSSGRSRSLTDLYDFFVGRETALRLVGIAALLWLPWRLRRFDLLPLPVLFVLFVAAIAFASGFVTDRYTQIFLPFLCVAPAAVALSLFHRQWLALAAVVAVSAASGGPLKSADGLDSLQPAWLAEQIEVLRRTGQMLRPDETLVVCNPPRWVSTAVISLYASNNRHYVSIERAQHVADRVTANNIPGPVRGICEREMLAKLSERLIGLTETARQGDYILWTAEGVRPDVPDVDD